MLPERQHTAYQAFSEAAKNNGILDPKTTRLIYLAVAMTIGCYP